MSGSAVTVSPCDPLSPEALQLIGALDQLQLALYPAESNHLVPPDALRDDSVHFLGARRGAELIGCGAVVRQDGYGEIKRLYVDPSARGLGVALAIMDALETHLKDYGITTARLETGINQPDALALYGRLGYTRCGPFGDYVEDPLSVFMQKTLG